MLKGHGAPNTGVVGNVGDYFEDLDTGKIYKLATIVLKEKQMGFVTIPEYVCETNQYVWVPVVDGGSSSDLMGGTTERENLVKGLSEHYESCGSEERGSTTLFLKDPKFNILKSYDVVIRGDVYKNLTFKKAHAYYDFAVLGEMNFLDGTAAYPFCVLMGWLDRGGYYPSDHPTKPNEEYLAWSSDGDWVVPDDGTTADYDHPQIQASWSVYPNLTIDEVQIYESVSPASETINVQYLPTPVMKKTAKDSIVLELDGDTTGLDAIVGEEHFGKVDSYYRVSNLAVPNPEYLTGAKVTTQYAYEYDNGNLVKKDYEGVMFAQGYDWVYNDDTNEYYTTRYTVPTNCYQQRIMITTPEDELGAGIWFSEEANRNSGYMHYRVTRLEIRPTETVVADFAYNPALKIEAVLKVDEDGNPAGATINYDFETVMAALNAGAQVMMCFTHPNAPFTNVAHVCCYHATIGIQFFSAAGFFFITINPDNTVTWRAN